MGWLIHVVTSEMKAGEKFKLSLSLVAVEIEASLGHMRLSQKKVRGGCGEEEKEEEAEGKKEGNRCIWVPV